jgi:tRNA-guanine family transglycosylase
MHNLTYTMRLMENIRSAIADGRFSTFHEDTIARRLSRSGE